MNHPATHGGCQTFRFLARCWRITHALELIEADPTAAQLVEADITSLDGYLDLAPATPGKMRLLSIEVDKDHALNNTALDTPILVVRIVNQGDDLGYMVIDGWHRIYRARIEGLTGLPAYLLSTEAEAAVRIPVYR